MSLQYCSSWHLRKSHRLSYVPSNKFFYHPLDMVYYDVGVLPQVIQFVVENIIVTFLMLLLDSHRYSIRYVNVKFQTSLFI